MSSSCSKLRRHSSCLSHWVKTDFGAPARQAKPLTALSARYSLIITLRAPEAVVDLYTPIAQQVAAQVAVPVVVNT